MKNTFIYISIIIFSLSGCTSTPKLSDDARKNIRSVHINQNVEKGEMSYQGPDSGAFAVFGAIGGLAAMAANESPGEALRTFAEKNGVHIEKIVLSELTKALRISQKLPIHKENKNSSNKLNIQVYMYGFSIPHGLTSDLYPTMGIRLTLLNKSGEEIWSARDFITAISSDLQALTLEKMHENPKLIETAWRDTAKVLISNIVNEM